MKRAIIAGLATVLALAFIFSRTTSDFDAAQARMSAREKAYLHDVLARIRPGSSRDELVRLLGTPRLETPWGSEWDGPSFPSRIRVYRELDGRPIEAIAWRKIGWFDVRFRPGQLPER